MTSVFDSALFLKVSLRAKGRSVTAILPNYSWYA
jgi:hypothetical protein